MPVSQSVLYAFLLTIFAGISTGIGSFIAIFAHRTNTRFLSFSLGLSAGVMLYVSFVELLSEGRSELSGALGNHPGGWATIGAFLGGMILAAVIDKLVPSYENPHELRSVEAIGHHGRCGRQHAELKKKKLLRTGVYTAFVIAIHNFPEGIATFTAAYSDLSLGIAIALAIALHNIPEGIAVAVPIYFATGNKRKALWFSLFSGFAEPLGALLAYAILMPFLNNIILGVMFCAVAGIMVFIALDELLPASREYGEPHLSVYGLIGGIAIMAVSLLLL